MAIKKSDLYSSLWASCDELRGGMDASQYKDYVLFMLFTKYVSDKYAEYDGFEPPIVIPRGASFKDMVALKGDSDIGNKINTQVIQSLIDANSRLARSDFPDFNDPNKLGEGSAKVERLGNLIGIFENPALDFSIVDFHSWLWTDNARHHEADLLWCIELARTGDTTLGEFANEILVTAADDVRLNVTKAETLGANGFNEI
jgi:HsdM N-terminal domain